MHEQPLPDDPVELKGTIADAFAAKLDRVENAFLFCITNPIDHTEANRFLAGAENGYILGFQSPTGTVAVRADGSIGFLHLEDGRRFTHDELLELESMGRVLGKWWREGWPAADRKRP